MKRRPFTRSMNLKTTSSVLAVPPNKIAAKALTPQDWETRSTTNRGGGSGTNDGHDDDDDAEPSDTFNYALLVVLYTLQGIPMGLSASIPFLLQEKIQKLTVAAAAVGGSAAAAAAASTTTVAAEAARQSYNANGTTLSIECAVPLCRFVSFFSRTTRDHGSVTPTCVTLFFSHLFLPRYLRSCTPSYFRAVFVAVFVEIIVGPDCGRLFLQTVRTEKIVANSGAIAGRTRHVWRFGLCRATTRTRQ